MYEAPKITEVGSVRDLTLGKDWFEDKSDLTWFYLPFWTHS